MKTKKRAHYRVLQSQDLASHQGTLWAGQGRLWKANLFPSRLIIVSRLQASNKGRSGPTLFLVGSFNDFHVFNFWSPFPQVIIFRICGHVHGAPTPLQLRYCDAIWSVRYCRHLETCATYFRVQECIQDLPFIRILGASTHVKLDTSAIAL